MNQPTGCTACKDGMNQPFPFSMAFQPIVDVTTETVYAYEALVRGPGGESAGSVMAQVTEENRYSFDQGCRVAAITLAAKLGLAERGSFLSINFMPGAVYSPAACIQLTLKTAHAVGFPTEQLIFEITEAEEVLDRAHLGAIVTEYRRRGFKVALDDFGAGYSGFNLLADLPVNVLKLDMDLTRDLANRPAALAIVKSMVELSQTLGNELIAEGVETVEEYRALEGCGIRLMQGYLFAKPGFESLPDVTWPKGANLHLSVA
jgi:EAL domain-containing protein (putative c-di-GMP-specific phosphodiesterase class I)